MRILLINVNTTTQMTADMARQARAAAAEGTEIVPLTPRFGAESCEGYLDSYLAAVGMMDELTRFDGEYDAVIQAGYGEHGREGLQELTDAPVVDITEAGAAMAQFLGASYSVVTTLDRAVPMIEERLQAAGLADRLASVRASELGVLELEQDPQRAVAEILGRAHAAVEEDRAEAIVLGCGGMSGLDDAVREGLGVPVVDGVQAAVGIAEGLVRMGVRTSKVRAFAPPREKRRVGWPLPDSARI